MRYNDSIGATNNSASTYPSIGGNIEAFKLASDHRNAQVIDHEQRKSEKVVKSYIVEARIATNDTFAESGGIVVQEN